MHRDIIALSFGAGVQSTALLMCSNLGLYGIPRADVAVFADVGCEPHWVYQQVEAAKGWSEIPIETVRYGNLLEDMLREDASIRLPVWSTGKDGRAAMFPRQCTDAYKVQPIERYLRQAMGYSRGQWVRNRAVVMIGISVDEFERARDNRTKWITNSFPLLDANLSRDDCKRIARDLGHEAPLRSACIICPFHGNDYWLALKTHFRSYWDKACEFDDKLRGKPGLTCPVYLHKSRKPLREVNLHEDQLSFSWLNDCGGICGL